MNLFISWSGKLSHDVGSILSDWIQCVSPTINTFLSSSDIVAGSRWSDTIARQLENCQMGVICITSENINSSWINFEAGALSKNIEQSSVIPILINVSNEDLKKSPLSQFQTLNFSNENILKLVELICKIGNDEISSDRIQKIHETWFPVLKKKLGILDIQKPEQASNEDKFDSLLTDFNNLKTQFDDKFKNINSILSNITLQNESIELHNQFDYEKLLGFWMSDAGSHYYALMIEGELFFPYLYEGSGKSHVFNIKVINDSIYGRFCWFNNSMKGYIYFKIIDENTLEGGWLFDDDIDINTIEEIKYHKGVMSNLTLTKMTEPKERPEWVNEYINEKLYEIHRF